MCDVIVLYDGYSFITKPDEMLANCTCTLVKGNKNNIIVDTMTPWDSEKILTAIQKYDTSAVDINYVISTHNHSDHLGNNNLFLNAKHLVGFNLSYKDTYYFHPFDKGEEYKIDDHVRVIPTPGHTLSDVTVLVAAQDAEMYAITGDLFEKAEDIEDPDIWRDAGSENPKEQVKNRSKVADLADWIIPGHGPKFKVTKEIREKLKKQVNEMNLET